MSNTDKAAEKLVSSIRSGKAGAGKKTVKKAPTRRQAAARQRSAGKDSAPVVRTTGSGTGMKRRGPDAAGRKGYALGGLRWPD